MKKVQTNNSENAHQNCDTEDHPLDCLCDECLIEVIITAELNGGCAFPSVTATCVEPMCGPGCHFLMWFRMSLEKPEHLRQPNLRHFLSASKKVQKNF